MCSFSTTEPGDPSADRAEEGLALLDHLANAAASVVTFSYIRPSSGGALSESTQGSETMSNTSRNQHAGREGRFGFLGFLGFLGILGFQSPAFFLFFEFFTG